MTTAARLLAIYVAPGASAPAFPVPRARAIAGRGLEGDRYAVGGGTFSARPGGRDVTLIEIEALEEFAREYHQVLDPAQSRRNLLTRGVRLNDLVGREFMVGGVALRGLRRCEPCTHLARLTVASVLPGLVGRGGLYAEVLRDGDLAAGDTIQTTPSPMAEFGNG